MEIGLRHTGEYSYRDIWLSVTQSEGDSIPPRTDTLHIYLTDEKGHWVQSGAMGGLYQHVYVSDKPVIFSTDSIDRIFRITHLMRQIHCWNIRCGNPVISPWPRQCGGRQTAGW